MANAAIYCPVQLSIDNHTLTVIASDTSAVQPLEGSSIALTIKLLVSFKDAVLIIEKFEDNGVNMKSLWF